MRKPASASFGQRRDLGPNYTITGPAAVTHAEIAEATSEKPGAPASANCFTEPGFHCPGALLLPAFSGQPGRRGR